MSQSDSIASPLTREIAQPGYRGMPTAITPQPQMNQEADLGYGKDHYIRWINRDGSLGGWVSTSAEIYIRKERINKKGEPFLDIQKVDLKKFTGTWEEGVEIPYIDLHSVVHQHAEIGPTAELYNTKIGARAKVARRGSVVKLTNILVKGKKRWIGKYSEIGGEGSVEMKNGIVERGAKITPNEGGRVYIIQPQEKAHPFHLSSATEITGNGLFRCIEIKNSHEFSGKWETSGQGIISFYQSDFPFRNEYVAVKTAGDLYHYQTNTTQESHSTPHSHTIDIGKNASLMFHRSTICFYDPTHLHLKAASLNYSGGSATIAHHSHFTFRKNLTIEPGGILEIQGPDDELYNYNDLGKIATGQIMQLGRGSRSLTDLSAYQKHLREIKASILEEIEEHYPNTLHPEEIKFLETYRAEVQPTTPLIEQEKQLPSRGLESPISSQDLEAPSPDPIETLREQIHALQTALESQTAILRKLEKSQPPEPKAPPNPPFKSRIRTRGSNSADRRHK